MSPAYPRVRAEAPWSSGKGSPEDLRGDTAPRQEVRYECTRGHVFPVPFAAGAEAPADWECRCGQPARLEGAPEDATKAPDLPGYTTGGTGRYPREREDTTPMAQLWKRRTRTEGDAILAEALERARQTGAAR